MAATDFGRQVTKKRSKSKKNRLSSHRVFFVQRHFVGLADENILVFDRQRRASGEHFFLREVNK